MISITSQHKKANQNHSEISSHSYRVAKIQNIQNNKRRRGCGERGIYCCVKHKLMQPLGQQSGDKTNKQINKPGARLAIWSSNPTSTVYISKWHERTVTRCTCTTMLIAALVREAKIWNQPKLSSVEWINTMWHIHNGILFSYPKNGTYHFQQNECNWRPTCSMK